MNSTEHSIEIRINGKTLREYYHDGNYFIEGREGSKFDILIRNNSYRKAKAIVSVDGLDVIKGEPAGINSSSYIVDPHSSIIIEGWRTSNNTVAEFLFKDKRKSYSKKMNYGTDNVGVIGAMFFHEKVKPIVNNLWLGSGQSNNYPPNFMPTSWSTDQYSIRSMAVGTNSLGTGFGNDVQSNAYEDHTTKFEPNPYDTLCLYYDSRAGLEKRGIIIDPSKSMPNAFPTYYDSGKYAKRPIR